MTTFAVKRNAKTGRWNKSDYHVGLCSDVTWDELVCMLRQARRLKDDEDVNKLVIEKHGVVFYIEPKE
jgi:hypothetical protein